MRHVAPLTGIGLAMNDRRACEGCSWRPDGDRVSMWRFRAQWRPSSVLSVAGSSVSVLASGRRRRRSAWSHGALDEYR